MKKFILTFAGMFLALSCFAGGSSLDLKKGNAGVLKEKADAVLEIDYSKTMVEGKTLDEYLNSRGEDFVRDWPSDKERAQQYFVARLNQKSKGLQIVNGSTAKYKMIIHVDKLDMGNGGASFNPFGGVKAGGCIMSGSIEIVEAATGNSVCVLEVDEVKGVGHVSETIRIGLMYFQLATDVVKFK